MPVRARASSAAAIRGVPRWERGRRCRPGEADIGNLPYACGVNCRVRAWKAPGRVKLVRLHPKVGAAALTGRPGSPAPAPKRGGRTPVLWPGAGLGIRPGRMGGNRQHRYQTTSTDTTSSRACTLPPRSTTSERRTQCLSGRSTGGGIVRLRRQPEKRERACRLEFERKSRRYADQGVWVDTSTRLASVPRHVNAP